MKGKLITVEEYKSITGLSLAAIYKQVKENRVPYTKEFGRILIKINKKELA